MTIISSLQDFVKGAIQGPAPLIDPTDTWTGGQTASNKWSYSKAKPVTPITPKATPTPTTKPQPVTRPATNNSDGSNLPFNDIIQSIWGANNMNDANRILAGENAKRQVGPQMDIPNHINPQTGKWDDNAPVMLRPSPATGQMIASIDRGLWRINNITFFDYQKRMPGRLQKAGIHNWDDMLDPALNTKFAKIIYDTQGIGAWYGAK